MDGHIYKALQKSGANTHATPAKLKSMYMSNKKRFDAACSHLAESGEESFGVREEHRVRLDFFKKIANSAQTREEFADTQRLDLASQTHKAILCYSHKDGVFIHAC